MKTIKINNETYVLKADVQTDAKLKQEIEALKQKLATRENDRITNKYKLKYEKLWTKYRTLYMKYKHQSDRMAVNRIKYIEIIHKLQCEIINQAFIEDLIKEVDRMAEIEKVL